LASILAAEDYGRVNYYIAIASVASTISVVGLNTTVMTYLAKGNETILAQATLLVLVLSAGASIMTAVLFNNIPTAVLLIGLSAFAMTLAETLGRKSYRKYALTMISCRGSQFVLAIALYYVMGINGVILGYAIPSIILGYRLFKLNKSSMSLNEIRSRKSFVTHSYSFSLSQSVVAYADKLIIAPIFGFAILGVYQFGFQFLLFLSVIPASLSQYLIPQEASGVERKTVRRLGLVLAAIMAAISFVAIPFVIGGLFPNYTESIPLAQIMVLGIIPLTINALLNSRLFGRENSRPVLIGSIVYTGSLAGMLVVLGNAFGAIGLAVATVISLCLQSLTLWLLSHNKTDFASRSSPGKVERGDQ
jgi:O-antigen/teichoic acid export membrane protein